MDAYAVNIAATLEDGVTPGLLRIIDSLTRANALMLDFAANVRNLSRLSLTIGRNLEKAAAGATALGDASAGLTRASYVMDTIAASSADVARNLGAANAAARNLGRTGGGGSIALRAARHTDEDGAAPRALRTTAAAGLGALGYGVYENAKLTDIITRAVMTDGTPPAGQAAAVAAYRARIMKEAPKYGFAAHGLADFAESYLSASRLLRGMPESERASIIDSVLPFAAQESFLKGISLRESLSAFIGAAHMAGAYTPQAIHNILGPLMSTSLATNASMARIENAAGYAVPILRTGLDIDPAKVFTMVALLQRAGIQNTKSGTWIADLFMNAVPGNFGAGLFHNTKQSAAMRALGLLDAQNHLTYLDKQGRLDPLLFIDRLAAGIDKLSPIARSAALKQAFGTQGARAAALLSDDKVRAMLPMLEAAMRELENPDIARKEALQNNPAAQAHQVITNAKLAITNATATFMGPVNAALSALAPATAKSAEFAQDHPGAAWGVGLAGVFGGALFTRSAWNLSKLMVSGTGTLLEKMVIGAAARITGAEIAGSALSALTAGAGVIATLGVALAAAAGYALGSALKWALDQAISKITGRDNTLGGWLYDVTHPSSHKAAPLVDKMRDRLGAGPGKNWGGISPQAVGQVAQWMATPPAPPNVHVKVQIDGQDVRARVTKDLLPAHPRGPTTFNPAALPPTTGMTLSPAM
ncbi:hypothetical protein [Thiomonas sp.]|uniref:hypothetical protein n=1 Tax=Thiomonas sp. TaxID=2047785 RepID=UPI002615D3FB|nr:hypothetical protein [Thiomonas sp.]